MPRPSADGPGAPPEARARGGAQSNGRPYLAQSNGRPYLARPQAERARTPPAQEERAAMAAAQSAAYRDAVEQWRRLEARQEERRQRLEARASQEERRVEAPVHQEEAPPSASEPPAWVRAQGAPPAWAQRLEARVQAEEERSWGAPPDWGESRPWASPREVELRLWLSANVGSPARRRAGLPTFALSQSRSSTSRGLAQGRDSPQSGGAPQDRSSSAWTLASNRCAQAGGAPWARTQAGGSLAEGGASSWCTGASTRRSSWLARASRRWRRSSCRASRRRHCSTASR